MTKNLVALACGFLFALGLGLSGMTSPAKVLGFLNVAGRWDPSLLFVMAGAIAVYGGGYRLVKKRARPILDPSFHVPTNREITPALLLGSTLFGFGWGLAGYCPGPAISSLGAGQARAALFVGGLLLGMGLFRLLQLTRPNLRR